MKTLSLTVGVLALGLGLAGPAAAAVQPDTGIATRGCGDIRAAILGSAIDDLRSEYNRVAAINLLNQAKGAMAGNQPVQCEATLDQLTNLLRYGQALAQ